MISNSLLVLSTFSKSLKFFSGFVGFLGLTDWDIANIALFCASDMAAKITGVTIDATVGTTTALNYKITDIAFAPNNAS